MFPFPSFDGLLLSKTEAASPRFQHRQLPAATNRLFPSMLGDGRAPPLPHKRLSPWHSNCTMPMATDCSSAFADIDRGLLIGRHRTGYLPLCLGPRRTAASLFAELTLRAPNGHPGARNQTLVLMPMMKVRQVGMCMG